jgi:diguanylate cyclase (GGDEF)-like protein
MVYNTLDKSLEGLEVDGAVLELESHFFKDLLGRLEDPVFVKNNQHKWIFTNQAFEELVGSNDLIGKSDSDFLPEDQVEQFYEGDNYVIRTQQSLTQEEEIGDGCYALVKKIPILLPDNTIGLFGIIFDISEYRKVQLEVEKLRLAKVQSRTDPLTGLANRRYLEEHFTQLLETNASVQESIGLLHIDLDQFKEINDTRGHLVGDAVLVHIAKVLKNCLGPQDFIARVGGDEFVVVTHGSGQSQLQNTAQKIVSAAAVPFDVEDERLSLSLSVGVAVAEQGDTSLHQMLKYADLALYRAKQNGRGRYEQFTSEIQQQHDDQCQQRDEFRIAIEQEHFVPFYQPLFDTKTLEVIGVEALARWNHPERGILTPDKFLQIALTEKRIVDLDSVILRKAVQDIIDLDNMGCHIPNLSVNVSPQSLAGQDFIDFVKELNFIPSQLCFELVESMLLDEPNATVTQNITMFRELGIGLDIDDFGSGHTSLLGLLEIGPDKVKIDKRLVIPILQSNTHYKLVKSIISMANSLNLHTVAEGVETEQHRQLLLSLGCDSLQGFGYARPMSVNDLQALLLRKAAA